jgi:tetratricopeptide (TPR) repeat protein
MGCFASIPVVDESAEVTVPGNDKDTLLQNIRDRRKALSACPQGHPDRATHAQWLGHYLYMRHSQTGDNTLLDEAIDLEREALALRPPGHPNRALSCAHLAASLHERYTRCGDLDLLDEEIELDREALALRPSGHHYRALSCGNLASSLQARYKQCGDLGLLDEAIELEREALELRPPGHPDRSLSCANLGNSLGMRYRQCGDLGLLDKALELSREALDLQPPGHPDRAISCGNLAPLLHAQYEQCGDLGLLNEAIELYREGLDLRPPGHPDRSHLCRNLSYNLMDHCIHTKNAAVLEEAIELCGHDLEQAPSLEAWWSFYILSELHTIPDMSRFSLGSALRYLDLSFGSEFDSIRDFIHETRSSLSRVWDASIVWTSETPLQLCIMYTQLIDRLPLAAGFVFDTQFRLQTLKSTHHIGTDACVVALLAKQPPQAIELLDRAHGIVWAQALHQRDHQMDGAPPELAAELAGHLRAVTVPTPAQLGDSSHIARHQDARHKLKTRIQAILREICATLGSERFMLGNTYATLRKAAHKHPVVVLVAGRGHAFALIMASAAQDQPHELRLELNSDDVSALRLSAEQAGLQSRADMRGCEPEARVGAVSRRIGAGAYVNDKPHQVLADIWRKIIRPVLRYLHLEVGAST